MTRWPTWVAAAWIVANAQYLRQRLRGVLRIAGGLPLGMTNGLPPDRFAAVQRWRERRLWGAMRGISQDRLVFLGEEYQRRVLEPRLHASGRRLIEAAQRNGERVVLLSDNLDLVMRPLARALGIAEQDVVANRLHIRDGVATGALHTNHLDGLHAPATLSIWASDRGIDLKTARVYGSCDTDAVLLHSAAQPHLVGGGKTMRRIARQEQWPTFSLQGL